MGVIHLWSILEPVKKNTPLSDLIGLTLAVDLSIWVCESNAIKQMQGVVLKPHLRNLFFRVSNLTQMGIKLIFAIDGEAPDLKSSTMVKRQQARFPGSKKSSLPPKIKRKGRSQFNSILRECCELLDYLGIPYVYSRGEAEALCAFLDSQGIVDGCLTDDGDAFLYGARTVYRNFTLNTKDPHVESYTACDIEERLGLNQEGLIGLALLLGCDYLPKGVPGVGKEQVLKLIKALENTNILDRFSSWTPDEKSLDGIEKTVWKKAMKVPDFPNQEVIDEFLITKDTCPLKPLHLRRPWIEKSKNFLYAKLEWPLEYSEEKVLPLITLWDMKDIREGGRHNEKLHLVPYRIVKRRVRQGVPCLEIEWNRQDHATEEPKYYSTIEEDGLFSKCFPVMVDEFVTAESNKKATTGRKKVNPETKPSQPEPVSCVSLDNVIDGLSSLNLDQPNSATNTLANQDKPKTKKMTNKTKPGSIETVINNETFQMCTFVDTKKQMSIETSSKLPQDERSCDLITDDSSSVSPFTSEYVPLSQRIKLSKLKAVANNISSSQTEGIIEKVPKDYERSAQKVESQKVHENSLEQSKKDEVVPERSQTDVVSACGEKPQSSAYVLSKNCESKHRLLQNTLSVKRSAIAKNLEADNLSVKPVTNTKDLKMNPSSVKPVPIPISSCCKPPTDECNSESDKGDNPTHGNNFQTERKDCVVDLPNNQFLSHASSPELNSCVERQKTRRCDMGNFPSISAPCIKADLNSYFSDVYKDEPKTEDLINHSNSVPTVEGHDYLECSMNNSCMDLFSPVIPPTSHSDKLCPNEQLLSDKLLLPSKLRTPQMAKNKLFNTVLFDTPNCTGNSPGYGVFNIESSLLNVTGDKLICSRTPESGNKDKDKLIVMPLMNKCQETPLLMSNSLFDDVLTPVCAGKDDHLRDTYNKELGTHCTVLKEYPKNSQLDSLQVDLDRILQNCSNLDNVMSDKPYTNKQLATISSTCYSTSINHIDQKTKNTYHDSDNEMITVNEKIENKENIEFESSVTKRKSLGLETIDNVGVHQSSPLSLVDRLRAKMSTNKQSEQLYNDMILRVKGPLNLENSSPN